jgi:hypothetical protein
VTVAAVCRQSDSEIQQALLREIRGATGMAEADEAEDQTAGTPEPITGRQAERIRATVRDGAVTLSGTVRSWTEGRAVIRATQAVPCVRSIDNRLRINPNV